MEEKMCETCHSYKGHKGKVFLSDGICSLIPSKPQFVRKNNKCKHWTQRKEAKDERLK